MFIRVESAVRADLDSGGAAFLGQLKASHPSLAQKISRVHAWDCYWIELPELGQNHKDHDVQTAKAAAVVQEIFGDPVLGQLSHSLRVTAFDFAPVLDFALEKRFRPGVTDNLARTVKEALEIVAAIPKEKIRVLSGRMLGFVSATLSEVERRQIARGAFANELIETWREIPRGELGAPARWNTTEIEAVLNSATPTDLAPATISRVREKGAALDQMSVDRLWALSPNELRAIENYFARTDVQKRRQELGWLDSELSAAPTDVEFEILAQTWSEHCKHKIFGARILYSEIGSRPGTAVGAEIPDEVTSLFKTTISQTTTELPKPWLLSVFSDNAGIVAFDEDDAVCIKVETHNSPSALDPFGGALTGIVGVNRDILGSGLGAKPIFNTNVFCVAPLDTPGPLPDRLLPPRQILEGVRKGVEHGGNQSGIPTVNGAVVFDERYLGKPLVYCGTGGLLPRMIAGRRCETKEIVAGDRIVMAGGRIGKDGIHGATFSSLALDESSPLSAVQLGDPITQKRVMDFLIEARDRGLYRAVTDNGAGGLSSSVGELAQLSGGAKMDVGRALTKYPGLKPFELVVSESQERMTFAVPEERLRDFAELAQRRSVEWCDLGSFEESGTFEVLYDKRVIASIDLEFLHGGAPRLEIDAVWDWQKDRIPDSLREKKSRPGKSAQPPGLGSAESPVLIRDRLFQLLGRPNIASKEGLIRQYDHEVQGASVIKPLTTSGRRSSPNDAGVVIPRLGGNAGLGVACGILPKLSDHDPYVMAQAVVDESVRNLISVGCDFGEGEVPTPKNAGLGFDEPALLALVDNFCWPDPVGYPDSAAALVRTCFGLRDAALGLRAPLVSGKDSMKNDYSGKKAGVPIRISVPPTLLMTAIGKVPDLAHARMSAFARAGDLIYVVGALAKMAPAFSGSEYESLTSRIEDDLPRADWPLASRIYRFMSRGLREAGIKLASCHDISEGGVGIALVECLFGSGGGQGADAGEGLGASLDLSNWRKNLGDLDPTRILFGEGFHSFVVSVHAEDVLKWKTAAEAAQVPFVQVGEVIAEPRVVEKNHWIEPFTVTEALRAWQSQTYGNEVIAGREEFGEGRV